MRSKEAGRCHDCDNQYENNYQEDAVFFHHFDEARTRPYDAKQSLAAFRDNLTYRPMRQTSRGRPQVATEPSLTVGPGESPGQMIPTLLSAAEKNVGKESKTQGDG
jgi:hypothetical protein